MLICEKNKKDKEMLRYNVGSHCKMFAESGKTSQLRLALFTNNR